jgi:hypothetical protein
MPHVVADLHQVVDLAAAADHGVADGAAVDGRIRADLHVVAQDAAADVHDLLVPRSTAAVAEAIDADARARMQDAACADDGAVVDRDVGVKVRAAPIRQCRPTTCARR